MSASLSGVPRFHFGFDLPLSETFGDHDMVGDVRGEGLLACIEFVANKAERRLFDPGLNVGPRLAGACCDEGLILRPLPDGDMLGFSPPLIVTEADVEEMIARMKRAVDREADALVAEGAWRLAPGEILRPSPWSPRAPPRSSASTRRRPPR